MLITSNKLISPVAQWKRTRLLIWGFWVRVPAGLYSFFPKIKNNFFEKDALSTNHNDAFTIFL